MPPTCSICRHPKRDAIDLELLSGTPYRSIAAQFGVSSSAVNRHKDHLPGRLAQAHEAAETASAGTLLDRLRDLTAETRGVLQSAKDTADPELALKAIVRLEKQLELEGKLLGELSDAPTINVTISAEWLQIRAVIITALTPFPDASRAVAGALHDA